MACNRDMPLRLRSATIWTSNIENNYEKTEPMLETISELLTDSAKVVLTTRRTAIFDGDEFHQWIASHQEDFDVIRIRIHEPELAP